MARVPDGPICQGRKYLPDSWFFLRFGLINIGAEVPHGPFTSQPWSIHHSSQVILSLGDAEVRGVIVFLLFEILGD